MPDTPDNLDEKVQAIFAEIAGTERANYLRADVPSRVMDQIANAISLEHQPEVAAEIGFHLGDWQREAAFLVALHLFPERFTREEIDEGVRSLLLHVPAHVIAAARLAGHATEDIFHNHTSD
ncbi:MAG TPA: hypothetical protein VFV83_10685 [Chthoniobacteraceae bacterium]|nr:hypothetical protein [Chthoniobacteraceae bacterium]